MYYDRKEGKLIFIYEEKLVEREGKPLSRRLEYQINADEFANRDDLIEEIKSFLRGVGYRFPADIDEESDNESFYKEEDEKE